MFPGGADVTPEAALSKAVAEYLALRFDVLITRVEAGAKDPRDRRTEAGTADWCGVVEGGRHIEIELKAPTGRSRPSQLARCRAVERLGGVYAVCRSVSDVKIAIERAKSRPL